MPDTLGTWCGWATKRGYGHGLYHCLSALGVWGLGGVYDASLWELGVHDTILMYVFYVNRGKGVVVCSQEVVQEGRPLYNPNPVESRTLPLTADRVKSTTPIRKISTTSAPGSSVLGSFSCYGSLSQE